MKAHYIPVTLNCKSVTTKHYKGIQNMAYIFGLCNTSPSVFANILITKNILTSPNELAVVPVGTVLADNTKPTRSTLFIVTIADLLRNLPVLNGKRYRNCSVFVFASPIRLVELTNIVNLDLTVDNSAKGFGFSLLSTDKIDWALFRRSMKVPNTSLLEVYREEREHLTYLTDSVKKGSLLTPLMTFIYTLPSSTLQTPVKLAVARILIQGLPLSSLESVVSSLCEYKISSNAKDKLVSILDSAVGKKYFDAFKFYCTIKKEKGSAVIANISKKFDVSAYEIRYLLSVLESTKVSTVKKKKAVTKKAVTGITKKKRERST